ncbi:MAG: type II CAAX endopeptidase family protein [Rubrobacteraceae bacterium]
MKTIKAFIERYPVATYFVLAFAISWGGILILAGPGGISANGEPSEALVPLLYPAMLLGPSVTGILLTGIVSGRAGFRDLFTRLTRWRVGARWYAIALLTAPLLVTVVLLGLSLTSPVFLPSILTTDDRLSILLVGIVAGLMVGIFEELGWTGFAIPRLRLRYGVLGTGLIVGLVWGVWHLPLFFWGSGITSGALPLVLFLPVLLFTWLPAIRVLMVWVYDRTGSLPVTMLMHTSLVASTLTLPPLTLSGVSLVTYDLAWAAVLWIVIAAVAVANGGQLSRQPFRKRAV